MGYSLQAGEGMAGGVRRIVAERLDDAVAQLEGRGAADRDEAVHEARKDLKKARSALRLVRDDLPGELRRRENAAMRDAARRLSGVRDAQVKLETLAKLADDRHAPLPAAVAGSLRSHLSAERDRLRAEVEGGAETAGQVARELRRVRRRVDSWPLADEGPDAATEGLGRMQRRGRRAMRRALEVGDDESWHEWRKRVKDLWYANRILRPVAPRQLGGAAEEADELSDLLGDHNDLAVLSDTVRELEDELPPGHAELLHAALVRRRDELRLAAAPAGARLLADRPAAVGRRLQALWQARLAEEQAAAHWLSPELAAQVRRLVGARESAEAARRRRISAELRELGFRVTEFEQHVPRRRGGFRAADFDALVDRGVIRLGSPPAPAELLGWREHPRREPPPPAAEEPTERSAPHGDGRSAPPLARPPAVRRASDGAPPAAALVRGGLRAAAAAARWTRGRLRV